MSRKMIFRCLNRKRLAKTILRRDAIKTARSIRHLQERYEAEAARELIDEGYKPGNDWFKACVGFRAAAKMFRKAGVRARGYREVGEGYRAGVAAYRAKP